MRRDDGFATSASVTDRAFISGITGKDDSNVAGFLEENGYEVHGVKRRASTKGFPFDTCRRRSSGFRSAARARRNGGEV